MSGLKCSNELFEKAWKEKKKKQRQKDQKRQENFSRPTESMQLRPIGHNKRKKRSKNVCRVSTITEKVIMLILVLISEKTSFGLGDLVVND